MYNEILNNINELSYSTINTMLLEHEVNCNVKYLQRKFPNDLRNHDEIKDILIQEYNLSIPSVVETD